MEPDDLLAARIEAMPWLAPGADPVADLDALLRPFLDLDPKVRRVATAGGSARTRLASELPGPLGRAIKDATASADAWMARQPPEERKLFGALAALLVATRHLEMWLWAMGRELMEAGALAVTEAQDAVRRGRPAGSGLRRAPEQPGADP
jgi:hypothetical protein